MYPHIFLTGHPSVGKTTIVKQIIHTVREKTKTKSKSSDLSVDVKGFYTEECRCKEGNRIGFDIQSLNNKKGNHVDALKLQGSMDGVGVDVGVGVALSRLQKSAKKGEPYVGKYLVNIDNIQNYVIPSFMNDEISIATGERNRHELIVLDEVGKMEMLCPTFIPSVMNVLDYRYNQTRDGSYDEKIRRHVIIIGTIPTPRYGRVIDAVEKIRSREDVIVIHVTKSNRDELRNLLCDMVIECFHSFSISQSNWMEQSSCINVRQILEPYLYIRPIGASSLPKNMKNTASTITKSPKTKDASIGCSVLVSKKVKPKILILGGTSSPIPMNPRLSYCERSMWIILSKMFGKSIDETCYKPIKNVDDASEDQINQFFNLRESVLSKGICIWDVLKKVHKDVKRSKRKRQNHIEKGIESYNNILNFLDNTPSIEIVCFIGKKAHDIFMKEYKQIVQDQIYSTIKFVILPSSSPSNSRMSVNEKASNWKNLMSQSLLDN